MAESDPDGLEVGRYVCSSTACDDSSRSCTNIQWLSEAAAGPSCSTFDCSSNHIKSHSIKAIHSFAQADTLESTLVDLELRHSAMIVGANLKHAEPYNIRLIGLLSMLP